MMKRVACALAACAAALAVASDARAAAPDPIVLDLVVFALEDEREAVEANLPINNPQPGDRAWLKEADTYGFDLLQDLRSTDEFVPPSAEVLLELLPPPAAERPLPTVAAYNAAIDDTIAEIAAVDPLLADPSTSTGDEPATESNGTTGSSTTELVAIALGVLGLALGAFAIWRGRRHDKLAHMASNDGLTGLRNRRMFDLDVEAQQERGDQPTAMLMIDIDHFKSFNDEHGHAVGDEVLRKVGAVLAQQLRKGDVAYRYGGEEFCVLLPSTDAREAAAVGERIRRSIETIMLTVDAKVTASVGVAAGDAEELETTIDLADEALYAAKHAGRNRVSIA